MILTVVREMPVGPCLNPAAAALAGCDIVAFHCIAIGTGMAATATVVVVMCRSRSTSTLLAVAHVASLWPCRDASTPPVRALSVLRVEAGTLRMLIARVSTIIEAADVMIFAVVRVVSIRPVFDPITGALTWQLVVASRRRSHFRVSLDFLHSGQALEQRVRIACIANWVPAVRVGKVRLHKMGPEDLIDVLVLIFRRGSVNGSPQSLLKLRVDLPLILQAANEGLRTLLAATAVPPARVVVGAICQEGSAIPEGIEVTLVVAPPAASGRYHFTKVDDGQTRHIVSSFCW